MSCTTATSQPVVMAVIWLRIRSIWSASAPAREKTNCAYAPLSTARRLIRPPWKNGRPKASVLDFAMTVLSRSKNAAARVTSHTVSGSAARSAAVHRRPHPEGSSTDPPATWRHPPPGRCAGAVFVPTSRAPAGPAPATTPPRPLVVSSDDALLDDLLRLLAAAGATAELTSGSGALRRAHRDAPLVLLGADVLTRA